MREKSFACATLTPSAEPGACWNAGGPSASPRGRDQRERRHRRRRTIEAGGSGASPDQPILAFGGIGGTALAGAPVVFGVAGGWPFAATEATAAG